jgi:hypothetical protein
MDDGAVTAVVFANTPRNIHRIRDKVIHSLRCSTVPIPSIVSSHSKEGPSERRHAAKIG